MQEQRSTRTGALAVVAFVAGLVVLGLGLNTITAFKAMDQGHIGVIQEGGPLDGRGVAGVKEPGTGVENIGIFNNLRKFPVTQRNYIISADPNRGDRGVVDVFHTPTSDSVVIGVEGQTLFQLNTDHAVLTRFFKQFGVRTFKGKHPYDGDEGWANFLDQQFRPVLDNALREEIGKYRCPQLNAACALIKEGGGQEETAQNIAKIQDAIGRTLQTDLTTTLGGPYFENIRFRLQQITLPDQVTDAVNQANAAKAEVNTQRALAEAAKQKARAARELARAYRENPIAGLIEFAKALPEGSQPIINVGGGNLGLNVGRR